LVRRFTDVVIEDLYSGTETLRAQDTIDQVEIHDYTHYNDEVHLLLSRKSVSENDVEQINQALS
jgi:hypothetical protein